MLKYKDKIINSNLNSISKKCFRFIQKEINPIKYIIIENIKNINISFNNLNKILVL